jgi:hypothetical protein
MLGLVAKASLSLDTTSTPETETKTVKIVPYGAAYRIRKNIYGSRRPITTGPDPTWTFFWHLEKYIVKKEVNN